jgi:hypothetical protein
MVSAIVKRVLLLRAIPRHQYEKLLFSTNCIASSGFVQSTAIIGAALEKVSRPIRLMAWPEYVGMCKRDVAICQNLKSICRIFTTLQLVRAFCFFHWL